MYRMLWTDRLNVDSEMYIYNIFILTNAFVHDEGTKASFKYKVGLLSYENEINPRNFI